jgi:2,3,4,5-tetrahydropyridine-2-carboxylate N-succinyltransferase
VPAGSIVVPGTREKRFPAGTVDLQCAYIIGHRSERHAEKLQLNAYLRDLGVQL